MLNNSRSLVSLNNSKTIPSLHKETNNNELTFSERVKDLFKKSYLVNNKKINMIEDVPGVGAYSPEKLKILNQCPRVCISKAKRFRDSDKSLRNV